MKQVLLGAALCLTMITLIIAQKNNSAPSPAKAAFAKAYPGASKVKWEKEDGNYEVSFVMNGNEYSAIYDAKGALHESEQEIKVFELPVFILVYMKDHYNNPPLKGAARITKADGRIIYEATIKGKEVLFDEKGKFLKEVKD